MNTNPLFEVVRVDGDQVEFDYGVPREPGSMSTEMRPQLFVRRRQIPGTDRTLTQYFAYKRDASPTALLKALKVASGEEVDQFIRRTAVYLAAKLPGSYDCLVPAPSTKPLAALLADELAQRLMLPVMEPPKRSGKMSSIGVHQRTAAAVDMFDMSAQRNLKGHALIVDDFTTSGATFLGIAAALYRLGKITDVTAAGIAVI
jgi:predicted amidophosphoribosyltransferase